MPAGSFYSAQTLFISNSILSAATSWKHVILNFVRWEGQIAQVQNSSLS